MIEYYEHLCLCGCNSRIEIKKRHKYSGVPKYVKGHQCTGKKFPNKKGRKLSKEHKEKIGLANKGKSPWSLGKHLSKETKQKISDARKGMKFSLQHRINLSLAKTKEKEFTGFKETDNLRIRHSVEYVTWRNSVFERDNYTCQHCGIKSGCGHAVRLEAHHIKPFSTHEHLRFDVENGITYCRKCHVKLDKNIGKYDRKSNPDYKEFEILRCE